MMETCSHFMLNRILENLEQECEFLFDKTLSVIIINNSRKNSGLLFQSKSTVLEIRPANQKV